ncbi:MAG: hypothetical protein M0030_22000 [Actinomycetota bacterium]|nr:hypothetical protein [Actinomycetota bacterium]
MSDVARAGRYPADDLSGRARWFVAGTAVVAAVVAVTHGLLAGWLLHGAGWPWTLARAVVDWPSPVAQQVLAMAAAVALAALAGATRGYRRIDRNLSWPLRAAMIAAALGAGPMMLLGAVLAAVLALVIAVAAVIVIAECALILKVFISLLDGC